LISVLMAALIIIGDAEARLITPRPCATHFCTGWTILGMGITGPTNVVLSGGSSTEPALSGSSQILGQYFANVGVAQSGKFSMSGDSYIQGGLFLGSPATYRLSGGSEIDAGILQDQATNPAILAADASSIDGMLDLAVDKALGLYSHYASLPTTTYFPSLWSIVIKNPRGNVAIQGTASQNVLNLTDLVVAGGGTLTLQAPAGGSFILNITGRIHLSGGSKIVVAGDLKASSVLFRVIGTGSDVILSGGSDLDGIVLAPFRKVVLSGDSTVYGEIAAGGKQILLSGDSAVIDPCVPAEIPTVTP